MKIRTGLAGLFFFFTGCSGSPTYTEAQGFNPGHEPQVRVWLRSLGNADEVAIGGAGEVLVDLEGVSLRLPLPLEIERHGEQLWMNGRNANVSELTLHPGEADLEVRGTAYSGFLVVRAAEQLQLINMVALDDYTLGVLRGELPLPHVDPAAAGAQAIAVRAYTMYYIEKKRAVYDVDDTTLYQRYVGQKLAPDDLNLRSGVYATRGLYLSYRGRPLKAYYHSTCGGSTTDETTAFGEPNRLPLSGVDCNSCQQSKYWRWAAVVPERKILAAARLNGPLQGIEVADPGRGGRARTLRLRAGGQTKVVPAGDFRLRVGPSLLRSTYIVSTGRVTGGWKIQGGGWGHGVGLCQMGALGLAGKGLSATEIAEHYYPGAQTRKAY